MLAALRAEPTVLAVLAAEQSPDALCWQVVGRPTSLGARCRRERPGPTRPIRPGAAAAGRHHESTLAVSETIRLLDRAGTDLIVLHVFDESTAPGFWDQPAHAYEAWVDEFRSRCTTPHSARLELRSGSPGDNVVTVATEDDVDLVALAWSQRLDGRAKTVRASVLEASVPVLLVPIHDGAAPAARPHAVSSQA